MKLNPGSFRLPYIILLLCAAANIQAQILHQDFENLETLEEFRDNPPNQGQVDQINLNVSNTGLPIYSLGSEGEDKFLLVEKRGRQTRHFLRTSGIDNEQAILLQFELTGLTGSEAGKVMGIFIGKNLGNTSFIPSKTSRWAQLVIMRTSDNGWFIQNEVEEDGVVKEEGRTQTFSAGESVTIAIVANNSGETIVYDGPFGAMFFLEDNAIAVFVDSFPIPIVWEAPVYSGDDADISEVKFITWNTTLNASLQLDNFLLEEISFIPTPVGLVYFLGKQEGEQVVLGWKTSWEQNSSHFEVERSRCGKKFVDIGQVEALGTSSASRTYTFSDKEALQQGVGKLYYRLRQVDTDGTFSYSPVQVVSLAHPAARLVEVGPNPFSNQLMIRIYSPATRLLKVRLLNSQGKVVLERQIMAPAESGRDALWLEVPEQLSQGLYLMEVSSMENRQLIRLLKH